MTEKDDVSKTYHRHLCLENHITLFKEPGSDYLAYAIPKTGKAQDVRDAIMNKLKELKVPLKQLKVWGAYGTVGNNGSTGGTISNIKTELCRRLQWSICLFYLNEIPLKHLIKQIYGPQRGPTKFCGAITNALENCQTQPIFKHFTAISVDFPEIDVEDLSTDQRYITVSLW